MSPFRLMNGDLHLKITGGNLIALPYFCFYAILYSSGQ